ncbi:hypothetical protein SS50377_20997 [Spironucleus salmonicida]|uniref:Uncharacterized protein n=1 Tax=Spironucleus salmonicida TaxID=348837 RepID=V6LSD7_9EUKA|nr:hypothetical protein SS50377_20997 [Spironucleus salmonicida]|eukprot:EST43664.1 Hypothetical protein SS50377_16707 [Spironucleus salmonicida]
MRLVITSKPIKDFIFSLLNTGIINLYQEQTQILGDYNQVLLQSVFLRCVQLRLTCPVAETILVRPADYPYLDGLGFRDVVVLPELSLYQYISKFLLGQRLATLPPYQVQLAQAFATDQVRLLSFELQPCQLVPVVRAVAETTEAALTQAQLDAFYRPGSVRLYTTNAQVLLPGLALQGAELDIIRMEVEAPGNDNVAEYCAFREDYFALQAARLRGRSVATRAEAHAQFLDIVQIECYTREVDTNVQFQQKDVESCEILEDK